MTTLIFDSEKIANSNCNELYTESFVHLFCSTWQASYVQFSCIDAENSYSYDELLSFILKHTSNRNHSSPSWIGNTIFQESNREILVQNINGIITDLNVKLEVFPEDLNLRIFKEYMNQISTIEAENIYEIIEKIGLRPNCPDDGGPNYQYVWTDIDKLYYLHVHLES